MKIITTTDAHTPAHFLANSIIKELEFGKRVLWFVTGGSSIEVVLEASRLIASHSHHSLAKNLRIMITDERYGPKGHGNSNWAKLIGKGFNLPDAKIIHVLTGRDIIETTKTFNATLRDELREATYKIGLFGIGKDGHTAGILPRVREAIDSENFAYSYDGGDFLRITITPEVVFKLDEAVVFMQGQDKWHVIDDLEKNIPVIDQPAQILKMVPRLTIFTDKKII